MSEKTYNTGRVVGWSSYEEFLKETGLDSNDITSYVYQTLVTYGVTRIVSLRPEGWVQSHGGRFYMQTVSVPGASWGAVPILGLDYEYYLDVFTNPGVSTEGSDESDVIGKTALEEAVSNIFTVYVSDEYGNKSQSAVDPHGYLTFVAYPDVVKFQEDVAGLSGRELRLVVRGLSLEGLTDISELYFGPQGLMFAGNGFSTDSTHQTENINNLMIQASSYITLSINGNAFSTGGGYLMYSDADINLEGVVSGYLDTAKLTNDGYVMDDIEVEAFITTARAAGVIVTTDAYDVIDSSARSGYLYLVYGSPEYTNFPSNSRPIYILCIRREDGYTGLGVTLGHAGRAKLGYDASNPDLVKPLCLLYTIGTGSSRHLILKDKSMPDYIGAYWRQPNGWDGQVSYIQQNGLTEVPWSELQSDFGAQFHDEGRNSYISCTSLASDRRLIPVGSVLRIVGATSGPEASVVNGIYVCTESVDSGAAGTTFNRRGGYLNTTVPTSVDYEEIYAFSRLPMWDPILNTDNRGDRYLVDMSTSDFPSRIYQNELIYVTQPGSTATVPPTRGLEREFVVVNIETNTSADLIVYKKAALPTSITASGVSDYAGSLVNSQFTNAIKVSSLASVLPTTVEVYSNPYQGATASSYTISRGEGNDIITSGTIIQFQHSVSGVFGKDKEYWYQYLGESSGAVLASSVSQKGGTNFYTLSGMTSHLNQGFPRSKQDIPDALGSYHYDYPKAVSRIPVEQFFTDFGLDITQYLHPDFRGTSMLKFLQNLLVYEHLGKSASVTNKRNIGFSVDYYFYKKTDAASLISIRPTVDNPVRSTLHLDADTDPTSFSSPGFFLAHEINPEGSTFNLANPDYPIWATIAKSRTGAQTMSVSLIDADGSRLNGSGSEGSIDVDTIKPNDLLVAFALGKALDVLKGLRIQRISSGGNYLVMDDGTRVYITNQEPQSTPDDPIPEGSIGIGF